MTRPLQLAAAVLALAVLVLLVARAREGGAREVSDGAGRSAGSDEPEVSAELATPDTGTTGGTPEGAVERAARRPAPESAPGLGTLVLRAETPEGAPLAGVVVVVSAAPAEGPTARVVRDGPPEAALGGGATDASGRWSARFEAGAPLGLRAAGASETRSEELAPLERGEVRELDVVLAGPATEVAGRVVDAVTGDPLADAGVAGLYSWLPPPVEVARTDADGRFALTLTASFRLLAFAADGYAPDVVPLGSLEAHTGERALVVPLSRHGRLVATVVDGDGVPLPDVVVQLVARDAQEEAASGPWSMPGVLAWTASSYESPFVSRGDPSAVTDANGSADVFPLRASRAYGMALVRERLVVPQQEVLVLAPGEVAERRLRWAPPEPQELALRVTRADGEPVSYVEVQLESDPPRAPSRQVAVTLGSGRTWFEGVDPGRWTVDVAATEVTPATRFRLEVAPAERAERELVLAPPEARIRGRVVAQGAPSAAEVRGESLSDGGRPALASARAGSDGSFEIALPRAGRYALQASTDWGTSPVAAVDSGADDVVLELAGEATLVLDVRSPWGAARGRWWGCAELEGRSLRTEFARRSGRLHGSDVVQGEPGAAAPGQRISLSAGTWTLLFAAEGSFALVRGLAVAPGEVAPLAVALAEGGLLRVAAGDGEGTTRVEVLLDGFSVERAHLAPGGVRLLSVPAGALLVRSERAGRASERTVLVRSGRTSRLELP